MTAASAQVNLTTTARLHLQVQANFWNDAANAWFGAASEFRTLLEHRREKNYYENSEWLDMRNRAFQALKMKAVLLESVARGDSFDEYIWRAKIAP